MNAFAPSIGQSGDPSSADKLDQPAGKVAARKVAVPGPQGPAGDQAERYRGFPCLRAGDRRHPLGVIQEAEIVLAALADDDLAVFLGGLRKETIQLTIDLLLQIAGIGR